MTYQIRYLFFVFLLPFNLFAQKNTPPPPKLIVGVVVDQMRYDYLYKYWDSMGDNGFKRLLGEGFSFDNCQFDYVPTYTGPGHSCIFTGTTPSTNGIVSNNWYDRKLGASIYCADDSTVQTVGSNTVAVGKMSPNNLLSTTIGDELRIATNFRARVVGVALKDRSCILPAGRGGNAAYWFDGITGNFVSSTYYMTELPKWMQLFNEQKLPQKYLSKPWETIQPLSIYPKYCAPDDNRYEGLFSGEKRSVFPHNLPAITAELKTFDVLRVTPWGNTITKDIALAALENEKLGKGDVTDMLTISFSSPDYIGHQFGPQSVEVMDNYLRLDKDIADLLSYLDKNYGKNNVLLFLTADHGAAQNIVYMQDHKLASGSIDVDDVLLKLRSFAAQNYADSNMVEAYDNQQVYLNHQIVAAKKLNLATVQQQFADFMLIQTGVAQTITATELQRNEFSEPSLALMQRGFYAKRSGDVLVNYEPGWMDWGLKGTSHGSPFSYDTHVPLIWYGYGIKHGSSSTYVRVKDIASTISVYLHIPFTNGNTGQPLNSYMKRK